MTMEQVEVGKTYLRATQVGRHFVAAAADWVESVCVSKGTNVVQMQDAVGNKGVYWVTPDQLKPKG